MSIPRILLAVLLSYSTLCAAAETVLVAPSASVRAGERFAVSVYFNNASDAPEALSVPRTLRARLHGPRVDAELALAIADATQAATITLPPGGFRKVVYETVAPPGASGTATLALLDRVANAPLVAFAGPAPAAEPAAATAAAPPPAGAPASQDALGDSFNASAVLSRFDVYEPMYFAVGSRNQTNAKFQFSFRYRLYRELNLGYTQTSLWDLQSDSKPFYDSAYKPRIFWFREALDDGTGWLSRIGLEAGVGHESNGKDGANSRSINIAYVTPRFTFGDPGGYHLLVAPRVLAYLEKTDNPDINDYRGYVDLSLKLGKRDGLLLSSGLRRGSRGYSAELDLSYPMRALTGDRIGGYLQLQYFNGYGESLLDYNRRLPAQFRIGYMLVR